MHGKVKKMIVDYMKKIEGGGRKPTERSIKLKEEKRERAIIKESKWRKTIEKNKPLVEQGIKKPVGRPLFKDYLELLELEEEEKREEAKKPKKPKEEKIPSQLFKYIYENSDRPNELFDLERFEDEEKERIAVYDMIKKDKTLPYDTKLKLLEYHEKVNPTKDLKIPSHRNAPENKLFRKIVEDTAEKEKNRQKNEKMKLVVKDKGADFNKQQNDDIELNKMINELKGKYKQKDNQNDDYDNIDFDLSDIESEDEEEINRAKELLKNDYKYKKEEIKRLNTTSRNIENKIRTKEIEPKLELIKDLKKERDRLYDIRIIQLPTIRDDRERLAYIDAIKKRRDEIARMGEKQISKLRKIKI